ncbi:MAG: hypothetical protein Q8876_05715 [Bacillota bacterium]|nr:hypothetical protein [Bacillota bacterium]
MFKYLMFFLACSSCACADLQILEQFSSTFYVEIHGFLIYDDVDKTYGYYITGYFDVYPPYDCKYITSNFTPQSLESAQRAFPQYKITEQNYVSN